MITKKEGYKAKWRDLVEGRGEQWRSRGSPQRRILRWNPSHGKETGPCCLNLGGEQSAMGGGKKCEIAIGEDLRWEPNLGHEREIMQAPGTKVKKKGDPKDEES